MTAITLGLRIDVDTYRGTRLGVPELIRLFDRHKVRATFFFSVGPDNMGRHLFRLLKPAFLKKMLRSGAPSLYGWDILFKGTLGEGPRIGRNLGHIMREAEAHSHEAGLHAWDHYSWQAKLDRWTREELNEGLRKGVEELASILGHAPSCSAAPGWKANDLVLGEKAAFPFAFNSDCRGDDIFEPINPSGERSQPQIPSTLPAYDEIIGSNGITHENYNEHILSLLRPDALNVLTIHAEAEGITCAPLFDKFLTEIARRGISVCPLGDLLKARGVQGRARIERKEIEGREGWLAVQGPIAAQ